MDRVIAVHGLRLCVYPVTSYIKGSNVVNPNVLKIRVLACFAVISIVARPSTVRRQGFWHQWGLKLRESLAHLVDCIMRRVVCDASAAFRVYSV